MKSKKLFLPTLILLIAVFAMALTSLVMSIARKPTVTEQDFRFSITYELNGATVTLDRIYTVRYTGNDGYADTKSRIYEGWIEGSEEEGSGIVLVDEEGCMLVLETGLYPDYLIGDPQYDEFFSVDDYVPGFTHYGIDGECTDGQEIPALNAKILDYEYPAPIENKLVFSHLSVLNGNIVLLTLLIAAVALIVMLIAVKRDRSLPFRVVDAISVVLNLLVLFIALPVMAMLAIMFDITEENGYFLVQILYFIPAISVLLVALTVGMRRRRVGLGGIVVQLIGPVTFAGILALIWVLTQNA